MTCWGLRSEGSYDIESPLLKRLRRYSWMEWLWRLVNKVGVELARVAPFCKVNAIMHHGGSIITHSFDAITQLRLGLVYTTHT